MTVWLVCGPPCAGKTTWALAKQDHALIVDHDLIAQALGSDRTHYHQPTHWRKAERTLAQYVEAIAWGEYDDAVVVRSPADKAEREAWAERLGAEVVLLIPDRDTLTERAAERDPRTMQAIEHWFDLYHATI